VARNWLRLSQNMQRSLDIVQNAASNPEISVKVRKSGMMYPVSDQCFRLTLPFPCAWIDRGCEIMTRKMDSIRGKG
jgi:hypothetical protein